MPKKKSPNSVRIRISTAEFLTCAYQTGGDGVEVRVQDGTIWLSQKYLALLFETTPENVLMHLKHIYADHELHEAATAKEYLAVQTEGKPLLLSKTIEEYLAQYPEASPRSYAHAIADQARAGLLRMGQAMHNVRRCRAQAHQTGDR
jgi:hypothetical protein